MASASRVRVPLEAAVDCERASSDEAVLEARRSDLPEDSVTEFQVHGMFKMAADGRPSPTRTYLTIRELSERRRACQRLASTAEHRMAGFGDLLATAISDELDGLEEEEI